jgi:hypothetical protein
VPTGRIRADDVDVRTAPSDVVAEHLEFLNEDGGTIGYPTHLFRAVVSGKGCPACDWTVADGSRFEEALTLALDSSNFDGDPIDLIESFL